jgi:hypothetical protein
MIAARDELLLPIAALDIASASQALESEAGTGGRRADLANKKAGRIGATAETRGPPGTPRCRAGGSRFQARERTQQNPEKILGRLCGDRVDNTTTTSAAASEDATHGQAQ